MPRGSYVLNILVDLLSNHLPNSLIAMSLNILYPTKNYKVLKTTLSFIVDNESNNEMAYNSTLTHDLL
jgi:hypothetical protein